MSKKIMAFYFTRSTSLKEWVDKGLFYREKQIYEYQINSGRFDKIIWFTYGKQDEKLAFDLKEKNILLNEIEVVGMPKLFFNKLGMLFYSFLLPIIHSKQVRQCSIHKSNQMDGAWSALIAKYLYGGKFVFRTGYTLTTFLENMGRKNSIKYKLFYAMEKKLYQKADVSFVTSQHDKEKIEREYGLDNTITILHNFIDTELFKQVNFDSRKRRICFVGRLNEQKNLINTLEAVAACNIGIDIFGNGESKDIVENYIQLYQIDANLMGTVKNVELPDILNQYGLFILSSYYEGMPKTLLEAMSCGCICIGTAVEGIKEVIIDGFNGFLASNTDKEAIKSAISSALDYYDTKKTEIAVNSHKFIEDGFSLRKVAEQEWREYEKIFTE